MKRGAEAFVNRDLMKGVVLGAGAVVLAPYVFPILARSAKPALGAAIKAGVSAWERGRESLAEMGEYAEDMIAEARAEREGQVMRAEAASEAPPYKSAVGGNGAGGG